MKKKILVLSQFFYPDRSGTGKILAELFLSLPKEEFEIDVVSGRRIYNEKVKTVLSKYEQINNINIYRVFKYFMPKEKCWGRLFNYIGFFLFTGVKVFSSKLYKEKNIIFSVSNPPIMPLLGAILKAKNNKFIYLIHDLYPDVAVKLGFTKEKSLMARIMYNINKFVFKRADKILVLGRDMKYYIMKKYNISDTKIEVFTNWATKTFETDEEPKNNKFKLIYTGNIGNAHNLDIAIKAAKKMSDEIELIFVGEGSRKASLQKIASGARNIRFLSYLNDKEYEQILKSADALLLSLEIGLAGLVIPSKLYTYLSAGKPIIAICENDSEIAFVINEETCGIIMPHLDLECFIKKLSYLIQNKKECLIMGNNARIAFVSKYERSILLNKYIRFFKDLI